jgi:hypothetical protein
MCHVLPAECNCQFFSGQVFCATCSQQLDLDIDACRGQQAPHRFSGLWRPKQNKIIFPPFFTNAASMEADVMEIPFKTYVNTKDFVKTAHYCFWIEASSSLHGVWE